MIFMNVCVVITDAIVMVLRDFEPYGTVFVDVFVVIADAIVMLLKDFGPNGIIFTTMCVYYFRFPVILDRSLLVDK
jgi:hypothetical protein